jgi:hypothetical protein
MKNKTRILFFFLILCGTIFGNSVQATQLPILNFSDLINGPKSGLGDGLGEGTIVTIWGNNLGSSQGTSKVYFKDSNNAVHEAAYVYYWKNADGQLPGGPSDLYTSHQMQEIAFSIPSASADGAGKIYVEVGGINSTELDFTIRSGSIFYVDANSLNNPGSGTYNDPWRSPASYIAVLNAGTDGNILYFKSGVYSEEYAHIGWHSNFCLEAVQGGSVGFENAFVEYPGENAIISATAGSADYSAFRIYDSGNNPQADNIVIGKLGLQTNRGSVTGVPEHWRIIGNNIVGLLQFGGTGQISTGDYQKANSDYVWIFGNSLHGGRSGNKLDHAIYPGSGTKHLYIGWNYIYDNNFDAGPMISLNSNEAYAYNLVSNEVYIYNNMIDMSNYPSRAMGVYETAPGSEVFYYNNTIIGRTYNDSATIYAVSANVHYYNNTLYNVGENNTAGIFWFYDILAYDHLYAPESIEMRNNIVYADPINAQYYVKVAGTAPTPTQSNDIWYGIGSYLTHNSSGGVDVDMIDNQDPLFTDPLNNNFILQSTSPAINSGTTLALVPKDFLGISRPQGSDYDIGAFEYASAEEPIESCFDNIQNQDETGIDCGGVCDACEIPITYTLTNFISAITNWLGIGNETSDVNSDGVVNTRDLGVVMSNWSN